MSYIPDPANLSEPIETRPAKTAAAEFRALKAVVAALSGGSGLSAVTKSPKRQAMLAGLLTQTAGTGINLNITGTNAVLSFADGYDSTGPKDLITILNGTIPDAFSPAPQANAHQYIFADYVSPTTVTFGATPVCPEYGEEFHPRFLITCEPVSGGTGSDFLRDYFGGTVVGAGGVTESAVVSKYGTKSVHFPAAGAYLGLTRLGGGRMRSRVPWTMEAWVRFTSHPTAGNNMVLFTLLGTSAPTMELRLINTAGTLRLALDASSDGGASNDIANGVLGSKSGASGATWLTGQWYHIAICYSPSEGKIFVYVDGQPDISRDCFVDISPGDFQVGAAVAGARGFVGYMDDIRVLPGAMYGLGLAFTAPTAQLGVAGNVYDITAGVMSRYIGSSTGVGVPPVTEPIKRLYLGQFISTASSISNAGFYAANARAVVEFSLLSSTVNVPHNLGYSGRHINAELKAYLDNTVAGIGAGSLIDLGNGAFQDSSGTKGVTVCYQRNRTAVDVRRAANVGAIRLDTGAAVNIETASSYLLTFERNW